MGEAACSPRWVLPPPVYTLYLKPISVVGSSLNALRLLAYPSVKMTAAHITIRGPYKADFCREGLEEVVSRGLIAVSGTSVEVSWKERPRKKLFCALKCGTADLERLWFAPATSSFQPHITVYRGVMTKTAARIVKMIASHSYHFSFTGIHLVVWEESSVAPSCLFRSEVIRRITGERLSQEAVLKAPLKRRIVLIKEICSFLSQQSLME